MSDRCNFNDPIDREAQCINGLLARGDRHQATERLRQDLATMGQAQFMAVVGEAKAMSTTCPSLSHLEITPIACSAAEARNPSKLDISLVTPALDRHGHQLFDRHGAPVAYRDQVAVLPNYSFMPPPPVRCEQPVTEVRPVVVEQPVVVERPVIVPTRPQTQLDIGIGVNLNLGGDHRRR